jgi:DNA polymerase III delta subunit
MIYILHGENLSASRKTLINLQAKHQTSVKRELLLSETSIAEFSDLCNSIDMFGSGQFIVLDISGAGRSNLDPYLDVLKKAPSENIIVILSSKELSKANVFIKNAGGIKAVSLQSNVFDNANVFKFADLVFSGNREASYKEYQKLLLSEEDPFYLFSMLLYQLRNIAYAKYNSPMFNKAAPFVKGKSQKMAEKFSEIALADVYTSFYKIDKDVKLGLLPQSLYVVKAMEAVFAVIDRL